MLNLLVGIQKYIITASGVFDQGWILNPGLGMADLVGLNMVVVVNMCEQVVLLTHLTCTSHLSSPQFKLAGMFLHFLFVWGRMRRQFPCVTKIRLKFSQGERLGLKVNRKRKR